MTKYINKQGANTTLGTGDVTVYTAPSDAQIRALTIHNPTAANVTVTAKISDKVYANKTVTANSSEVLNQLFNQQLKATDALVMTGSGVNVLLTVVEITE